MTKGQLASTYHSEHNCNCAQAVAAVFAKDFGIDEDTVLKMTAGFGAGMGNLGQACGALSGAFTVIGLKFGDFSAPGSKPKFYALINKIGTEFKNTTGALTCPELKGRMKNPDTNGKIWSCPELIEYAADLTEKYLNMDF